MEIVILSSLKYNGNRRRKKNLDRLYGGRYNRDTKIYELKETDKYNKAIEWFYFLENPESERVKSIMKEKGMDISTIVELTGLTEEQIKVI